MKRECSCNKRVFSIKPVWRDSKNARNVATGEKVVIPARYQLKVKAARFLKEACERFNNEILSKENNRQTYTDSNKCMDIS